MARTDEEMKAIALMDAVALDCVDELEWVLERVNSVHNVNYFRLPLKKAVAELRAVYGEDKQGAA